jgi:two-component system, NarL family, sensor kinase
MNRIFFYSILFIGMLNKGLSQTSKIDSLKKICYSSLPVDNRIKAFLELMNYDESMPLESFGKIMIDADSIILKYNKPSYNISLAYNKSRYYRATNRTDSANIILSNTLELYKNNKDLQSESLILKYGICRNLVFKEKFKEAIESLLILLKEGEEKNNTLIKWRCSNSIGLCYMLLGRYNEAIEWFYKALQVKLLKNENYDFSAVYSNLASCQNNVKQYDSAFININRSIAIATEYQNLTTLANCYSIKADIFINTKNNSEAEKLLIEALSIRKKIGNPDFLASDMAQLGFFYADTKQFEKGILTSTQALQIFKENNLLSKMMFGYEALKVNYKNKGDNINYAATLEKMLALKDSLFTKNSAEALTELQQKFEVEKKEKTIVQQKLDLFWRNLLLYGSAVLATLLALFFAYRFKKYKRLQKIKIAAMMGEEKKLHEMAAKDAQEKERKRISAELHDNLGVQANAILHNSSLLNIKEENNKTVVTDLQETAKEMLLNLRETLWALKTTDVPAKDLWLRIINFMKQMGRHYTNIHFTIEGDAPNDFIIASSQALHIVLVLQESVNNSVKHANANNITIKSIINNKKWKVVLSDNGKGFEIDNAKSKIDSYGLSNMQQRAKEGGFLYDLQTSIGKGTKTIISINN